jgi:hypothetical protein
MKDVIAEALHAPFRSFEEATRYLEQTVALSGIRHLSYWFLNLDGNKAEDVVWLSTYDPAYMSLYMAEYTPFGDPGFTDMLGQNVVTDWYASLGTNPKFHEMLSRARRFGITEFGVSIAFNSPGLGSIVFSASTDDAPETWAETRDILIERFEPFAHAFHERMRPLLTFNRSESLAVSLVR